MSELRTRINRTVKSLFSTGFFHVFGSSVINKILSFLSSVVLVWILTKTEYGTFTYAWNIYSIVLIFNGMGIESGMLQLLSEKQDDKDYTKSVSSFSTAYGLAFSAGLSFVLFGIGFWGTLKIPEGKKLLCALCILPLFQLGMNLISCYLRAQKRNHEYAKLSVLNTVLLFIGSVGCSFLFREMGLVIGNYIAAIMTCLFGSFVFRVKLYHKEARINKKEKNDLLKIAFISMVNNGLSQLLYLLDVFVLGIVDPEETVLASYKVATMIPTALTFIPLSLMVYLYPYFAEHKDDGNWCLRRYKQILIGAGGVNFIISITLFVAASPIIRLLFGEQYLDAVPAFRILAASYFVSGTFRIISGNLLVTQRKLKFNFVETIISSLINIVADFFFIQWWGAEGAALASALVILVSSILSTVYLIYTFKKKSIGQETG